MNDIDQLMFVVLIRYTKPKEEVLQHLAEHQAFLKDAYARGMLVASGRGADQDPGVMVGHGLSRAEVQALVEQDPFHMHGVAAYEVIQFHASRACDELGTLFVS